MMMWDDIAELVEQEDLRARCEEDWRKYERYMEDKRHNDYRVEDDDEPYTGVWYEND